MMHLEPSQHAAHYKDFVRFASEVFARAFAENDTLICDTVQSLIGLCADRKYIQALKKLQKIMGKPV